MGHPHQHTVDVMNGERVMRMAIHAAIETTRRSDMPFGACRVEQKRVVVSIGCNSVATTGDPIAHTEIQAIREAARLLQSPKLPDRIPYSTCEPCPMCFGARLCARLRRIVYGACIEDGKRFGAVGIPIPCRQMQQLSLSKADIVGGVFCNDCRRLCAPSSISQQSRQKAPME